MRILFLTVALAAGLLAHSNSAMAADAKRPGRGKLTHMVAFKFKETASAAEVRKVEEAFAALPGKISQIASYEAGTNVSPEKLDKGFTHAFLLTFRSAQDRDEYLVHPDHKEFGKLVGPVIADVFVIDFWGVKEGGKKEKTAKPGKKEKSRPARKE
ncbi:MAG: Dabb family protein [Verrucomicrobiales bacterium]|nr:Dabb family protein [Verrucomicrobiales bacterium]